tara:strand:+ start:10235 stop:10945 length:711 start_codon:yes stop_codon:yes gene_type:complete
MDIAIYKDIGVSPAVESLAASLKELGHTTKYITAEDLINKGLEGYKVFFMPGGADLYYGKKLNGKGTTHIKDWVYNGGTYFGICAGAYFGSTTCEFDKGGLQEVMGDRELAFFPGTATGPLFGYYNYKGHTSGKIVKISYEGSDYPVYFNGGCTFKNYGNVKVLAYYKGTQDPAIIEASYGQGKAILSGIHYEITCVYLKKSLPKFPEEKEKITQLIADIKTKNPLAILRSLLSQY